MYLQKKYCFLYAMKAYFWDCVYPDIQRNESATVNVALHKHVDMEKINRKVTSVLTLSKAETGV